MTPTKRRSAQEPDRVRPKWKPQERDVWLENFAMCQEVCCLDWDGKLIVGNVLKQSIQQIWEGPLVSGIRAKHEQGRKGDLVACRDCNFRTRDAKGNLI